MASGTESKALSPISFMSQAHMQSWIFATTHYSPHRSYFLIIEVKRSIRGVFITNIPDMETLPTEFFCLILHHLEKYSLQNLPSHFLLRGLSNKAISKRFIIKLWLQEGALRQLVCLSKNPALAERVTEITFTTERLKSIRCGAYVESICHKLNRSLPGWLKLPPIVNEKKFRRYSRKLIPAPKLRPLYERYRACVDNQSRMKKRGTDVTLLVEALKRLGHLEITTVDNRSKAGYERLMGDAEAKAIQCRYDGEGVGKHLMEVLFRAMAKRLLLARSES